MKRLQSLLLFSLLALSNVLFALWEEVDLSTDYNLLHVDFVDENFGWVYGESRSGGSSVFITNDGGDNWYEQPLSYSMYNCEFVSPAVAYGGYTQGYIYTSTDYGVNWDLVVTDYEGMFDQFYFTDDQTGWAAGSAIYFTEDGGSSWQEQDFIPYGHTWEIEFLDSENGARVGFSWPSGQYAYISVTDNAGINWDYQQFNQFEEFRSIDYFDNVIIVAGNNESNDVVGFTYDSGENWVFNQEPGGTLQAASFYDETSGWILSRSGNVKRTQNLGSDWALETDLTDDPDQKYYDIYFNNEHSGWVSGANGKLHHYTENSFADDEITNVTTNLNSFPNPCYLGNIKSSQLEISFNLTESQSVVLEIYDIKGHKIKSLDKSFCSAGLNNAYWDGTDENNHSVSSGIYLCKLETSTNTNCCKLMLIK